MKLPNWLKSKEKPKTIAEIAEMYRTQNREFLNSIGWTTLGSKPEIIWVYTDLAGHNYYVSRNPWQGVTRNRLAAVEEAAAALDRRFSRDEGLTRMHAILTAFQRCQKGDAEASYTGYKEALEFFQIMKSSPSNEILMQYALHLILTDGEDPQTIDPEILKEKRARAENDIALKAFFLNMAQTTANDSLPILPDVGPNFTEAQETDKSKKKEVLQKANQAFMQGLPQKKN